MANNPSIELLAPGTRASPLRSKQALDEFELDPARLVGTHLHRKPTLLEGGASEGFQIKAQGLELRKVLLEEGTVAGSELDHFREEKLLEGEAAGLAQVLPLGFLVEDALVGRRRRNDRGVPYRLRGPRIWPPGGGFRPRALAPGRMA